MCPGPVGSKDGSMVGDRISLGKVISPIYLHMGYNNG